MPEPIVSPIDGQVAHEYELLELDAALAAVERAHAAQREWRRASIGERARMCLKMLDCFERSAEQNAREITTMMGKPLAEAHGEIQTMRGRVATLAALAPEALADETLESPPGLYRAIRHEPLGVVLNIAAWNYPLVVPINVVAGAVLAGDAVLIKHAHQTALCAGQLARAFAEAGAPEGLVGEFMCSHETVAQVLGRRRIDQVAFTGSVRGGREVYRAAARDNFIGVGLELGGKDAALVLPDCDFDFTVANLVEGAFYNAGQSCCAIERIYVHEQIWDRFVEAYVEHTHRLVVGDPLAEGTSLGPLVDPRAVARVSAQLEAALEAGAKQVSDSSRFALPDRSACYMAPAVLTEVDHSMALMRDETFGPVIGLMKIRDEAEALALINDSRYGLTASIWSRDDERVEHLAAEIETGTVFQNRCDFLDPELPWVGVKDSGHGVSLSHLGLRALSRPKSLHFRRRP